MGQFKLKFEIDEIEFEAEGEYEEVARERRIFVEEILSLAAKINGCKCECKCECEEEKEEEEVEVVEEVKALKNEKIHAIEDNLIVTPAIVVEDTKKVEKTEQKKSTPKKKSNKKKTTKK